MQCDVVNLRGTPFLPERTRAVGQELKEGVRAQSIMIALVFVAGEDAKQATADHLEQGVLRLAARVIELLCKARCQLLLFVPLPKD